MVLLANMSTAGHMTNGIDGYRILRREQELQLGPSIFPVYAQKCEALALVVDRMLDACELMGFNTTRDVLRVVDGIDTDQVTILPTTLPILFEPFWDYATSGLFIAPGQDGNACVVSVGGIFDDPASSHAFVVGSSRKVREAQAQHWIGYAGGTWKNGWYEDPVLGMKWHFDLLDTTPGGTLNEPAIVFDLLSANQSPLDCLASKCNWNNARESWGSQLSFSVTIAAMEAVQISNGARFGKFWYSGTEVVTVSSVYSIDQTISMLTLTSMLLRWMAATVVLARVGETIGLGALANTSSFWMLPVLLLPRLKTILEAFWTVGCQFEGSQRALGESWFVIYPAIGETVLLYFSLLNWLAKIFRRRMSDVLFGPTLLAFGLLHYVRFQLLAARWVGSEGRISSFVTSDELSNAALLEFFTTDLAFRINGRVRSLFTFKLAVFAANLLPLVVGSKSVVSKALGIPSERRIEKALAVRFAYNGGIGLSQVYAPDHRSDSSSTAVVVPYELVRAGYAVLPSPPSQKKSSQASVSSMETHSPTQENLAASSTHYVVAIVDWLWLVLFSHFRTKTWLYVVRVSLLRATDSHAPGLVLRVDDTPRVGRVGDDFGGLQPSQITACACE